MNPDPPNPDDLIGGGGCVDPPAPVVEVPGGVSMIAVGRRSAFWEPGRTLGVRFLNGTRADHLKVMAYATEWEKYGSLKFRQVTGGLAEIRVVFQRGANWSYIGNAAEMIPPDRPTMQLGDLVPYVGFHEFGHAGGLEHEMGHPHVDLPWNRPAVYDYYLRTQGWGPEMVDTQVFAKIQAGSAVFTDYDPKSVMHYPVEPFLLTDPSRAVGWNETISRGDALLWGRMYPFVGLPESPPDPDPKPDPPILPDDPEPSRPVVLTIDGPARRAPIRSGAPALYRLDVVGAGSRDLDLVLVLAPRHASPAVTVKGLASGKVTRVAARNGRVLGRWPAGSYDIAVAYPSAARAGEALAEVVAAGRARSRTFVP